MIVRSLRILVADADTSIASDIARTLFEAGHTVAVKHDSREAVSHLREFPVDLVIIDAGLPMERALVVLDHVRRCNLPARVILTGTNDAMKEMAPTLWHLAGHRIQKPFDMPCLLSKVEEVLAELVACHGQHTSESGFYNLVGETGVMHDVKQRILSIAEADGPVLITGPSGTGKKTVARAIHAASSRASGPFVIFDCKAAAEEGLRDSELFERDVDATAASEAGGPLAGACRGTVFLAEVSALSHRAQLSLARSLDRPHDLSLTAEARIRSRPRIIAGSTVDLQGRVATGSFRPDLYYRFLHLSLPTLRERSGDLPLLIDHWRRRGRNRGEPLPPIKPAAWAALATYPFPGNVLELVNAIEHAELFARGEPIDLWHLPDKIVMHCRTFRTQRSDVLPLDIALDEFEHEYLLRVLAQTDHRKALAAQLLGISRKTLWLKLRRHAHRACPP